MSHIEPGKPLATFLVCSYNQEKTIHLAIEGALAQTYSPLEIIISDDCSTDNTYEIARRTVAAYGGPHTVIVNRNPENLGLTRHVNRVFELAKGELILGSAGDDISFPNRTECLMEAYMRSGKGPALIHSNVEAIDQEGRTLDMRSPPVEKRKMTMEQIATSEAIYIGATAAFSRELLTAFGPIIHNRSFEDLVWGFRAAIVDRLIYVNAPLVHYRVGTGLSSYDPCKLSWREFLARLSDRRMIQIDVLKQRLLDLDSMRLASHSHLRKAVRARINTEMARHSLLNHIRGNAPELANQTTITNLVALALELRAIGGYLVKCGIGGLIHKLKLRN